MYYYTYAYLREDKTPYYIGKGKGNRLYKKDSRVFAPPKDKSRIIFLKQNLTEEEAFKHEIYMIFLYGRKDLGTGILYNMTNGGEGSSGCIPSEETRRKLSDAQKGEKNHNYGKIFSEEHRRKLSEASKGRTHSEETKRKQSEVKIGKNNPNYGKKWWNDCCGNNKLSIKCPGKEWVLGKSVDMKGKSGKKWWNDGCGNSICVMECPGEDWIVGRGEEHIVKSSLSNKGKKWWNDCNGNLKRSIECPGENWMPGRGKPYKTSKKPEDIIKEMTYS